MLFQVSYSLPGSVALCTLCSFAWFWEYIVSVIGHGSWLMDENLPASYILLEVTENKWRQFLLCTWPLCVHNRLWICVCVFLWKLIEFPGIYNCLAVCYFSVVAWCICFFSRRKKEIRVMYIKECLYHVSYCSFTWQSCSTCVTCCKYIFLLPKHIIKGSSKRDNEACILSFKKMETLKPCEK